MYAIFCCLILWYVLDNICNNDSNNNILKRRPNEKEELNNYKNFGHEYWGKVKHE